MTMSMGVQYFFSFVDITDEDVDSFYVDEVGCSATVHVNYNNSPTQTH